MADLSITKANITPGTGATFQKKYNAGATITAGQSVRLAASAKTWGLAQADNNAEDAGSEEVGIAMHDVLSGQPLSVITGGELNMGAILTAGTIYVVSATAGGIAPQVDIASTQYITLLGYGKTTSILTLLTRYTAVTLA